MTYPNLATYLNDHLAGSVAALEILAHLEQACAETDLATMLATLRSDISADRAELEALMARLGVTESGPRKAAAWLGEKLGRLKLTLDDSSEGALRLFEGLEAVSLGIEGKRGLWQALAAVASAQPALRGVDYERLIQRAEAQRRQVEAAWLNAALVALAD
ncbi:MAG: hypothetical protein HGA45_17840 [Chloroflexales bacterium]|nr:hypothetical protein [Chloroflexales bacterium]